MSSAILKEIEEIIDEPLDRAIIKALINELRRKLSEYVLIDKAMRRRYGMITATGNWL